MYSNSFLSYCPFSLSLRLVRTLLAGTFFTFSTSRFSYFLFYLRRIIVLRDEFRLEPQNTRVAQGDVALLECAPPKGVPEPILYWKKNGQKLEIEHSKRIRIVDSGNLAIQDARQSDEGEYQCVAKNVVGVRESKVITLNVHGKFLLVYCCCRRK